MVIKDSKRIKKHPVLGDLETKETCTIYVDSQPIEARKGEPILAAMIAAGFDVTRRTEEFNSPRGLFCGIGYCSDCFVTVDGVRNVRSCITPVEEGMEIETQESIAGEENGPRKP